MFAFVNCSLCSSVTRLVGGAKGGDKQLCSSFVRAVAASGWKLSTRRTQDIGNRSDGDRGTGNYMWKSTAMSLSQIGTLRDIDGNEVGVETFKGKVVFVMNVASACGYTSSGYALFDKLSKKYSTEDFVAVAIPCNSFGFQESGTAEDIKSFALSRASKVVVMERSEVNGENEHAIVKLAKSKLAGKISWNFDGRYVFDRDGEAVARFDNSSSDEMIEQSIEKYI